MGSFYPDVKMMRSCAANGNFVTRLLTSFTFTLSNYTKTHKLGFHTLNCGICVKVEIPHLSKTQQRKNFMRITRSTKKKKYPK